MTAPLVVKIGSALAVADGRPNSELLREIAGGLAAATPVCVVSSGAIALGAAKAGLRGTKRSLPTLQAASALGQAELQRAWHDAFEPAGLQTAQVLLTGAEIADRRSYVNVRNALQALLAVGAVPILNENDVTATDEISFGDNDVLAAQVAVLLRARQLILLTSVEGVLDGVKVVPDGAAARRAAFGRPSPLGRGGMESKVDAAELAAAGGVATVIAAPTSLPVLLQGGSAGTRFAAQPTHEPAFKLWLRYGKRTAARLDLDAGAARAVAEDGRSLLAVGVVSWSSEFHAGDGVELADAGGNVFARGISSVDAAELKGRPVDVEVVHRDRLVLL